MASDILDRVGTRKAVLHLCMHTCAYFETIVKADDLNDTHEKKG